jgi:predicted GNAT family N-acyltransferase
MGWPRSAVHSLRSQSTSARLKLSHERFPTSSEKGQGLGARLMEWTIEQARQRGCALVQLTTDKSRLDAHRFYARLGFVASHEGMKRTLRSSSG